MADDPSIPPDDSAKDDPADDKPPTDLGDAGKKALDAERAARREAERELKELKDRDKSELERLQDEIKDRDSKLTELPGQVRKQAIRFASEASKVGFLDPEDALAFIGDVDLADADAVKTALADLAERKPHLVRADVKKKVPTRPKPGKGDPDESADGGLTGKKRAAAALRQMRS